MKNSKYPKNQENFVVPNNDIPRKIFQPKKFIKLERFRFPKKRKYNRTNPAESYDIKLKFMAPTADLTVVRALTQETVVTQATAKAVRTMVEKRSGPDPTKKTRVKATILNVL